MADFTAPPLLPQVDLNATTDDWQTTALPSTPGEVVGADLGEIGGFSKSIYNWGTEALEQSPIQYKNAFQYVDDATKALSDPENAGPLLNNKLLTPQEANQQYWQPGMPKFSSPVYEQAAQTMSQVQSERNKADDVLRRSGMNTPETIGNDLVRSTLAMVDPFTPALFFTPVPGEEALAARVGATFGKLAADTTVNLARITYGSIEQNLAEASMRNLAGEQIPLGDYLEQDGYNLAGTLGLEGLGLAFKGIARGIGFFKRLDPETQGAITNELGSDTEPPIEKILDMDKNIAEVEAQVKDAGGEVPTSTDERISLMEKPPGLNGEHITDPDAYRPPTSLELTNSGKPEAASAIEARGQQELAARAPEIQQEATQGDFKLKDNPVQEPVEPLIKPGSDIKEQASDNDKLLNDTLQQHASLMQQMQAKIDLAEKKGMDVKPIQSFLDRIQDNLKASDDEIGRVTQQKSLLNSAVQCAIDNGI